MALALAFGLLANLVVAATWVWPELLGVGLERMLWAGLAVVWVALLGVSFRVAVRSTETIPTGETDFFSVAQGEYLKGNWLAAEVLARQLLLAHPSDAEAALLLASTLRRAGRLDEAQATLEELKRWDRAAAWRREIEIEAEQIAERMTEKAEKIEEERADEAAPAEQAELEREVHDQGPETLPLPNVREAA
jgi:hypothetical protein